MVKPEDLELHQIEYRSNRKEIICLIVVIVITIAVLLIIIFLAKYPQALGL